MWSSSSSRPSLSSSSSYANHEKVQVPPSSFSHHRRVESARQGRGVEEDAWNLDDSDNEDGGVAGNDNIARVAAQAGLGRKASSSSLSLGLGLGQQLPAPTPAALASSSSASSSNSGLNSSKSPPSAAALHIAASLNGGPASPKASSSSNSIKAPPGKDRTRQPSYGFWERLSGIGAAVGAATGSASSSFSSNKEKDRERDDPSSSSSGYARFDEELELEDNFDGTYSVNAPGGTTGQRGSSSATSGANKLLAPATISRPSLGGSGALSSGRIPTTGSLQASAKGKSRSLESPGGPGNATIVGTPRPRSPLGRRKSDRPRDDADMRRAVRKDIEDVMKDPVNLLKALSLSSSSSSTHTPATPQPSNSLPKSSTSDYYNTSDSPPTQTSSSFVYDSPLADTSPDAAVAAADLAKVQAQARRDASRKDKFIECLKKDTVDIAELRKLAWAGIPHQLRPIAWQLLLGYLPSPSSRRVSVLARKRQEYADAVRLAFARGEAALDAALWHQIQIDVPRTNPGVPLWQFASTQRSLEKILYVWAIRHPASGYVQGINDLATPFFQVFLSSYIDCDPEDYDISALPPHVLSAVEADTFWCLSKLLDGIQDNYIFAQPGIHRQVARCQELCSRVDAPLAKHLEEEGVSFLQFSFRWFHLLFLRVLPVNSVIRMWDTYMSEGSDAFANFHIYVCLAFLLRWSEKLRSMDFQGIMLFLQDPVNHETWSDSMTELLLSEGFMWSALFAGSK